MRNRSLRNFKKGWEILLTDDGSTIVVRSTDGECEETYSLEEFVKVFDFSKEEIIDFCRQLNQSVAETSSVAKRFELDWLADEVDRLARNHQAEKARYAIIRSGCPLAAKYWLFFLAFVLEVGNYTQSKALLDNLHTHPRVKKVFDETFRGDLEGAMRWSAACRGNVRRLAQDINNCAKRLKIDELGDDEFWLNLLEGKSAKSRRAWFRRQIKKALSDISAEQFCDSYQLSFFDNEEEIRPISPGELMRRRKVAERR